MKKILFTAAFLSLSILGFTQEYKIANKIHLDGDMGWDYIAVDDASNRLFVSHGNMVQVVDLNNGNKAVATINGMNGVHGIAIANDLGKGFISSGKDSSVVVFDLSTYAVITKFKVTGANPDAIVYDKSTQRVFTFNGKSSNSTVIDAKTNNIIGTISLPGKPEFCVADGKGKLYDNLEDKSMICEIDANTMKVENTWPLAPGDGPSGLAIDPASRRLYSVCDNKTMVVMNADNGKVVTTVAIGDGPDAVGFDSYTKTIYSSNSDGTLTVVQEVNPNEYKVVENVPTQKRARTCAVNSKTHHVYLPTAELKAAEKTADNPKGKPSIVPGSFTVLDVAPGK
jgi:DNA-binding beta-propeller fold protein YncE